VASPEAAAELKRQSTQNRKDIEALYGLLKTTDETVKETNTKVDNLAEDVGQLRTQVGVLDTKVGDLTEDVGQLRTQVGGLDTKVASLDTKVSDLDTKVDSLDTKVSDLDTKVDSLDTKVSDLDAKVDSLDTKVDSLDTKVDAGFNKFETRFDQVETRFDRLELLLGDRSDGRTAPPSTDVMRTPQEKKLGVLETKMELYRGDTLDNKLELERHNGRFDRYDEQFDILNGQMTEVLGILRDKSA